MANLHKRRFRAAPRRKRRRARGASHPDPPPWESRSRRVVGARRRKCAGADAVRQILAARTVGEGRDEAKKSVTCLRRDAQNKSVFRVCEREETQDRSGRSFTVRVKGLPKRVSSSTLSG